MSKAFVILFALSGAVSVSAATLTISTFGIVGQTTVFTGSFTGTGLTSVGAVRITDSNSQTGGSPGVFSGFDLDFIFLDTDGMFATASDRTFATDLSFVTGGIRPTANPAFQPTAARPGPTNGSLAANLIDPSLSTLTQLDASFDPFDLNTDNVFGSLTLGDGGSLTLTFNPRIALGPSTALFFGEVGTEAGEQIRADVEAFEEIPEPIPEPSSFVLLAIGFGSLVLVCRRKGSIPVVS
ncbi:MAG: PEP-CTERM sorting domain-containing protein [Bryobacteraceae bacterium]